MDFPAFRRARQRRSARSGAVASLLALFLVPAAPPWAAAQPEEEVGFNRAVLPGETNPDVPRLLRFARKASEARNWPEAARAYAEILDRFHPGAKGPDAVVPAGDGFYVGAAEQALAGIADLPPEGRAACRDAAEPAARGLLERAVAERDEAGLLALIDRYPFTASAGAAFARLARRLPEPGRPGDAAALADRLPRLAPDVVPPVAAARLVTVLAVSQDRARLQALAGFLEREPAWRAARVRIAGRETGPAAFAREELAKLPPPPAAPGGGALPVPPGWPQYGGDAAHLRPMHPVAEPLRPLGTIAVSPGWGEGFFDEPAAFPVEVSLPPVFFPAVAEGLCVIATDRGVSAYPLDTAGAAGVGEREPAWRFDAPAVGGYRHDDRTVNTATIHRGRVIAALVAAATEAEHQSFIYVKYPFARRALVALDAWTGRLLWKAGGALEGDGPLDRLSFPLPPTPDGDVLYAGAVDQPNPTDPFAHYVVCLDAATGALRWKTYVAQGQHEVNLFNNPIRESIGTAVTVAGDTLYYGTNLGAVAALDRLTGRIRWIRKYEQVRIDPPKTIYVQPHPLRWANNPIVVAGGTVCVTPLDAYNAWGFDAATGALRWSIPHGGEHGEMWRYVLGVHGSLLVVSGRELMAVDLAAGGRRRWVFAPRGEAGAGKGGVTPDAVLFPTDRGLHRVDPRTGKPLGFRPWAQPEREAGNVIAVDGFVVAAAPRAVTLFETPLAQQALSEEALARDPENLLLGCRAGAAALAAGRTADGERRLRDALRRAADRPGDPDAARAAWLARRLLFLHLARAANREAKTDPARARALLADALAMADDRDAARNQALRVGEALREAGHPADALAVFQEILLEAPEPPAAVAEADEAAPAGDAVRDQAARAVEAILAAHGREPYAPYEAKAREALAAARRDPTLARFAAVTRAWPNSLAAREAGLERLGLLEQARAWEPLATAARAFLREHPDAAESADAARALATALEQRGQLAEAKRMIRQIAARWGDREILADGRRVRAAAWAAERLRLPRFERVADGRGVPDLQPPLVPAWTFSDRPAPPPPAGPRPAPVVFRPARLLAFPGAEELPPGGLLLVATDRTLRAVDLRSGQPAWEQTIPVPPRAAAAIGDMILVVADRVVLGLRARTGQVTWQYESRTPFHRHGAAGGLYALAAADPAVPGRTQLVALDPAGGRIAWSAAVPGFPLTDLFAGGGRLVFLTAPPAGIVCVDAATGQVERVTAVDPSAHSHGVAFLPPDRLALVSSSGRVVCVAPETGRTAWETALEGAVPVPGVAPAGGAALALVLQAGGARPQEVVAFDPASGRRIVSCADLPPPAAAAPVAVLTDGASAFVLLRGRERNEIVLTAFDKTRLAWTCAPPDPEGDAVSLAHPPLLAERHVILPMPRFKLPRGPWLPRVLVVDKAAGTVAQDLLPGDETRSLTPPRIDLFNGAITILSDGSLRLYRGR